MMYSHDTTLYFIENIHSEYMCGTAYHDRSLNLLIILHKIWTYPICVNAIALPSTESILRDFDRLAFDIV
jgi:hypothetical protein